MSMNIELKRVEAGYYAGSYRGIAFAVKKIGKRWRVHGRVEVEGSRSRSEAVRSFVAEVEARDERKAE